MTGSVCGYVVRADNEMPLQNASITVVGGGSLPDIAPLTNSAGWFALDGLSPGKWVLRARGPNDETGEATVPIFNDAFTNITILVAASAHDARSPVRQRPTPPARPGGIEGHVLHAQTGQPVENATITVVRGPGPVPDIAPLTDSTGWFALDGLLPGKWVLLARSPNDETAETTVQISSDGFTNVTITLAASLYGGRSRNGRSNVPKRPASQTQHGSVDGHVVYAGSGLPVENATVTIVQGAGPVPDIAPLTDSGGWFALDGLPPGEWVLGARSPNDETGQATVMVSAGDVAQITISVGHGRTAPLIRSGKFRAAKSSSPARKKQVRNKGRGKSSH
jgi:sarcosine oxidase gamma subunit